ncbi:MvdC/MvdD family ATP grasp protein [Kitasatospora sp. NPDC059408]|uniref:MvdC/MvdD family ATP grasp protein n=1 Tax=Kitasatospora sp. NPDC059408 TaxID=3346823 RepID=UPI003681B008
MTAGTGTCAGSTRGTSPRVLVITHDLDPTADHVLRELNARGVPFWRTDLADFPQRTTVSAELRPDGAWGGTLAGATGGIDLSELACVWWRKPTAFRFPTTMSGPEQRFAAGQAKRGLAGVLGSLPHVLWVNRPERNADCTKPAQLTAAAEAGLCVPATLVTNDPGAVRDFAERCGGRIVTKVLGGIVHTEDGKRGQIYTTRVPPDRWDEPRVSLTAHLFQEEITDKAYEVRVTCVAGRVFPVRIDAPDGPGRLDWRIDSKRLTYAPIGLPAAVRTGILDMLWRLGLVFAAVDLIVDRAGTHWLVDVNPGGQWAWIDCTRSAVTTALADLLQKGTT